MKHEHNEGTDSLESNKGWCTFEFDVERRVNCWYGDETLCRRFHKGVVTYTTNNMKRTALYKSYDYQNNGDNSCLVFSSYIAPRHLQWVSTTKVFYSDMTAQSIHLTWVLICTHLLVDLLSSHVRSSGEWILLHKVFIDSYISTAY